MLRKTHTGTWLPAWVPESTLVLSLLLIMCSFVQSCTVGYDTALLNALNILPAYNNYFRLSAATTGLNTASIFIGGILGPLFAGTMADRLGRRLAIFWSSLVAIIGVVLQTASQNIAMFVVGRIIIGLGAASCGIAGGVYLSESFPSRFRAWGVGSLNDFYWIGAILAAGITLGTGTWTSSSWAWRVPSLIQGLFSLLCILILPFVPESPRWLQYQGYFDEARLAVAQTNANGNISDPVVISIYEEIAGALKSDKECKSSIVEIFKDPILRRRFLIGTSVGPMSTVVGNLISLFYLGPELSMAGVTDSRAQLHINLVLNAWCLFCCLLGTFLVTSWGRRPTALVGQSLLIACLFIIGGLTKVYADNGPNDTSTSLLYGNVAVIFLFQGFYSLAWTPLIYLYPTEVMNYSIRANGVAFSEFMLSSLTLLLVFVMPIALENIGWKMYIINGSWDVIVLLIVALFWVETKGKTLEEVDTIFERGSPHSNESDIEARRGQKTIHVVEVTLQQNPS
ncbi:general substrate transporter [Aspergillus caelatus]|uniref:General substrate transporter n=1 Tax=Aspergillus caelatus TaxID=61420 RepID=A0A5N7A7X1_9EURO|nr:general substrate transporter [Aspergillus caelatus]KAE8365528.1 general substrate transporter [Aspergillus caelatus]